MPARKPLPEQTVKNLIPPSDDYHYFEDPQGNPFRSSAIDFELVNAGWLIDASLLAYGDEAFIRARVAPLPGARVRVFAGATTQAFALETDAFVIVAFRGTRVEQFPDFLTLLQQALPGSPLLARVPPGAAAFSNWRDLVTDGQFALGPDGVHTGFRRALDQVWGDVATHLKRGTASARPWRRWRRRAGRPSASRGYTASARRASATPPSRPPCPGRATASSTTTTW